MLPAMFRRSGHRLTFDRIRPMRRRLLFPVRMERVEPADREVHHPRTSTSPSPLHSSTPTVRPSRPRCHHLHSKAQAPFPLPRKPQPRGSALYLSPRATLPARGSHIRTHRRRASDTDSGIRDQGRGLVAEEGRESPKDSDVSGTRGRLAWVWVLAGDASCFGEMGYSSW